jgi:dTDP-4-dehydrorhamnose 3,5-epimerase
MRFTPTTLAGAWLIDLDPIGDDRGFFARALCQRELAEHGIPAEIRQINTSVGHLAGTFRGLHAQVPPAVETKIVRCTQGALLDVVVDLRPESATFGHTLAVELTARGGRAIVVPERCAHGFLTLVDGTQALYTVSEFHQPGDEVGLNWDDPVVTVDWPITPHIVSPKDRSWPAFLDQTEALVTKMARWPVNSEVGAD